MTKWLSDEQLNQAFDGVVLTGITVSDLIRQAREANRLRAGLEILYGKLLANCNRHDIEAADGSRPNEDNCYSAGMAMSEDQIACSVRELLEGE